MRALIKGFDAWICHQNKIFAFCDDPDCILKLQFSRAPHTMQLEWACIAKGEPVLVLHLWNGHLPVIPAGGADLTWATKTSRLFRSSLRLAARYAAHDPKFNTVRAVMAITSLFAPPAFSNEYHPMQRFGFTVTPYHRPLGGFGEFWENFYAWLLIWAYNPVSAARWNVLKARRSEIWMTAEAFLERYRVIQETHPDR